VRKATKFSRRTFGSAVRDERQKLGLSQEDFAERANVHRTYISSIELGKVSVGIEVAHELASALGLRLSELVRLAEQWD
jgi:transcriptional regulator with XRE-family HTH domain